MSPKFHCPTPLKIATLRVANVAAHEQICLLSGTGHPGAQSPRGSASAFEPRWPSDEAVATQSESACATQGKPRGYQGQSNSSFRRFRSNVVGRSGKSRYRQLLWHACCATKTVVTRHAQCSPKSTTGFTDASTPPT